MTRQKISVRNLVEFLFRSGDIDNRRTAPMDVEAMQEGSRLHRKIQKRMGSNYRPEVALAMEFYVGKHPLTIEGRADGIIEEQDGIVIDEIKCMYRNVLHIEKPYPVHRAQALCYAYMYLCMEELDCISIQLTYCQIETEQMKRIREKYSRKELTAWFDNMLHMYEKWLDFEQETKEKMYDSIPTLQFPYPYRKGQRDLVVSAYRAIVRQCNLYIQAPTGVGKTLSTIFPAVKAVGEKKADKIFYLTAKTITRTVAEEAFEILRKHGIYFPTVTITAKEKLCAAEEMECNPLVCHRAKGHFDRINDAVYDCICHNENITREVIEQYAAKHSVCPYEMCLDISNWMQGIICDYNYAFDPKVHLKRYFANDAKGEYILLVDEAHNLVERARQMYSAGIYKEDFLQMKKIFEDKSVKIARALEKCNKILLSYKRECSDYVVLEQGVDDLILPVLRLCSLLEDYMENNDSFAEKKEVLDFYFQIKSFSDVYEMLDESYLIYQKMEEDGRFLTKLFCVHPANRLSEFMEKAVSVIFFSATLLPVNYYKDLLSGNTEEYAMYVDSPFDTSRRLLMISDDVTSKYTRRNEMEYEKIVQYIERITKSNPGNYFVFFPSYQYMEKIFEMCMDRQVFCEDDIILQGPSMSEMEKEAFLQCFTQEKYKIGFCVMGGIFSEGIDLTGESLIGTIIIGNGLPQIGTEREMIREYFRNKGQNGFDYAYKYPGMNKVMQAAGRVIRTEQDKGVIALLEERFLLAEYQYLFPKEWQTFQVTNLGNVKLCTKEFWKKCKKLKEP